MKNIFEKESNQCEKIKLKISEIRVIKDEMYLKLNLLLFKLLFKLNYTVKCIWDLNKTCNFFKISHSHKCYSSASRIEMGGQGKKCLVMALCLGPGGPKVLFGTYCHM